MASDDSGGPLVMTRFTEAVPLSLSSVAHTLTPLEDGVLDGLKTILQHTLWSSLSYARAAFGRNFSPVDLVTSPLAWTPRGMKQTMTTKKKNYRRWQRRRHHRRRRR